MNPNNHSPLHRQQSYSQQSTASSHTSQDQYQRTPTSSTSSLDRSPNPAGSHYTSPQHNDPYGHRKRYSARQSFDEYVQDPHPGVLSSLDSTKATGYQNSLRRPGPPPLSHTTPNAKMMSPSIRHSSSFSIGDKSANTSPSDSESTTRSKRYSDEASANRNSIPYKKNNGLKSLMGSLLGSPRTNSVKISAPENPVHVTHVGYDNNTGQFTVSAALPDHLQFCTVQIEL